VGECRKFLPNAKDLWQDLHIGRNHHSDSFNLQWSKNSGITATHDEAINPESHNQTSDKGHKYLRKKHCAFIL